jgi:hypothetical protein
MSDEVYRVVREDGDLVGFTGRGSDPFSRKASAKARATQLTKEAKRYSPESLGYKVQVTETNWRDLNE